MRSLLRLSVVLPVVVSLGFGCGGEPPTPTAISALSGMDQTGTVDQTLAAPIVVRVDDQNGVPMAAVSVSFTVAQGGGSLSSATGSTNENGQASTLWTLGTVAGETQQVRATITDISGASAVFNATANPDEPFVISAASGNGQYAFMGTKLSAPIAVQVRDRHANNIPGEVVTFVVPTGRGSLDSAVSFTNSAGLALTGWTVGSTVGIDTAHATLAGVAGSPVVFTATVHNLRVDSVAPSPMVLGGTATVYGTGFSATPANNVIALGSMAPTVTSATTTELEISIPDECQPVGTYGMELTVGVIPVVFSAQVTPGSFLNMDVGDQLILQDPNEYCIQFDAEAANESYLIGVQSTSEAVTSLTPISLVSAGPGAVPSPTAVFESVPELGLRGRSPGDARSAERLRRHREVEAPIRDLDRRNFEWIKSEWVGPQRVSGNTIAAVDSNVVVDDTVEVRVLTGTSCNEYDSVTTVVRYKGTKGIWLEDVANPADGYTSADFEDMSNEFDELIYPADTAQFGGPSDEDENGRIVMVITRLVNEQGSLGFTTSCDYAARSAGNLASNEGEFFYGEAPDPDGVHGEAFDRLGALFVAPQIWAHELVHAIQISRRIAAGGSFPAIWIAEGQATMGEEVVGHRDEGRTVGQNLGLGVAVNWDDTLSTDWYSDGFADMGYYFGWYPTDDNLDATVQGAPHECSWLDSDNGGPCYSGRATYGVPWTLLRWLSDQYRATYPGGEAGLQQDIVNSTLTGYAMLESLIGVSIDSLLAQWAAALYVDDRLGGVNPTLTFNSWDLQDIFFGTYIFGDMEGYLRVGLRLMPNVMSFGSFTRTGNVRGGSTYYALISGGNRPGTAISALDGAGQDLPSHMQVWVVRMQ